MRTRTTYITSDGKEFRILNDAKNHENEMFNNWLGTIGFQEWLDGSDNNGADEYYETVWQQRHRILRDLFDHANG